jgi:DNA-binding beta-propeller fold protein YncE
LLQTLGTPGVHGEDATHFNRPTFIAWLPDGTFFVADGYNGTRVAKFDKSGKFLLDWGKKGVAVANGTAPPWDTRPGYFNNVHGIAVDPDNRRVFVNDRSNKRIQVFDENGKYLDEWSVDQDGNVYVSEVANGRAQKFRPRPGANPAYLIGKPVYSAWK